jgi:hypothetical protein
MDFLKEISISRADPNLVVKIPDPDPAKKS